MCISTSITSYPCTSTRYWYPVYIAKLLLFHVLLFFYYLSFFLVSNHFIISLHLLFTSMWQIKLYLIWKVSMLSKCILIDSSRHQSLLSPFPGSKPFQTHTSFPSQPSKSSHFYLLLITLQMYLSGSMMTDGCWYWWMLPWQWGITSDTPACHSPNLLPSPLPSPLIFPSVPLSHSVFLPPSGELRNGSRA